MNETLSNSEEPKQLEMLPTGKTFYKGFEFEIIQYHKGYAVGVPSFNGGCVIAASVSSEMHIAILKFMNFMDIMFIQPPVQQPRVGDYLEIKDINYMITSFNDKEMNLINGDHAQLNTRVLLQGETASAIHVVTSKGETPDLKMIELDEKITFKVIGDTTVSSATNTERTHVHDSFIWKAYLEE